MQYSLALTSAFMGLAFAQGVTQTLTPTGAAPAGCTGTFNGNFEITVADVTEKKRDLPKKREACGSEGTLVLTLADSKLTDAKGRTGYIAANYQFQFDEPPQDGTIYDAGFTVCEDNTIALGPSQTFYECLSGDFYNLYDRSWAAQCSPVSIIAVACGADSPAGQQGDGQVIGTSVVQTTIVTALSDGQPQVVTTSVPVTLYTTVPLVSEHSDGQPQVTTPASVVTTSPVTTGTPAPLSSASSVASSSVSAPGSPAPYSSVAPTTTAPVSTPASKSSTMVTSSPVSSSAASTSPAQVSPTATGGSSHIAAGSMGALVAGMFVAFLCL
ncbi:hypothetical protein F5Y16DRAFT_421613 [Xylariaceae sp. FL0255]|nr:hypothetical protein F5Y16DRAFT_421613 [Xylariaceae sp. FL0255]